jgi:isoleucyl-tRNA synthetase
VRAFEESLSGLSLVQLNIMVYLSKWLVLIGLRKEIHRFQEELRQQKIIGSALELKLSVAKIENTELWTFLSDYQLDDFFGVSQYDMITEIPDSSDTVFVKKLASFRYEIDDNKYATVPGLTLILEKLPSELKCLRCWKYSKRLRIINLDNRLCDRCTRVTAL